MTILPQKQRPPKEKPPIIASGGANAPSQELTHHPPASSISDTSSDPNSYLNRPSTSRLPPSSSSQPSSTTNVVHRCGQQQLLYSSNRLSSSVVPSSSNSVQAGERDRRLSKSLKRASATPPPSQTSQSLGSSSRRAKKDLYASVTRHHNDKDEACNSEDEYTSEPWENNEETNPAALLEREIQFERLMKEKGFTLRRMAEDGGCLFRAVADQVYGDQRWHDVVRRQCVDHMEKNRDYYSAFVTEEFDSYLQRKRHLDCFGNNIEIQALSEIYGRPVEIYRYSTEPINIFQTSTTSSYPPLRLSYHNRSHYNSLVSSYEATVGVGLGLPGYQPGIADRNLMREATLISENCEIEKAMLEDKLRETDWEKTQEALEKQVARESYVQWVREQEEQLLAANSSSYDIPSTSSQEDRSSAVASTSSMQSHPDCATASNSKKTAEPIIVESEKPKASDGSAPSNNSNNNNNSISVNSCSTESQPLSWEDWISDDASEQDIMLAVIARSQEDYMNSFSKRHQQQQGESLAMASPAVVTTSEPRHDIDGAASSKQSSATSQES